MAKEKKKEKALLKMSSNNRIRLKCHLITPKYWQRHANLFH